MFERFTERARRVIVVAQNEARGLDHDYLGTEHILLALMEEGTGARCGRAGAGACRCPNILASTRRSISSPIRSTRPSATAAS